MEAFDINFYTEGVENPLANEDKTHAWLCDVIREESGSVDTLSFIFCDDDYLYDLNVEYLDHDTLTDVITFQYTEGVVHGDIFISVERTEDNARDFNVSAEQELHRVLVHGVLHMLGYKDKTEADEQLMRQKENYYLAKRA